MKKKLLPLAIAAAMAPGFASAVDVSGFVDIIYTIGDDNSSTTVGADDGTEGKFTTSGEIDFVAMPANGVTVRLDVDVMPEDVDGGNAAVDVEQAYFAMDTNGVTVMAGIFGNPVGMECGDAPCMWGTNGGVVGNLLNGQTQNRGGNNVQGVTVSGMAGPATVTAGLLNELSNSNEESSFVFVVNASPVTGLDLELGIVTAGDATASTLGANSTEGATDFNVSYDIPGVAGLNVAMDYMTGSKVVDSAMELMLNYTSGAMGAGVRLETVAWESGAPDSERTTFHVSYEIASNLVAIVEVADGDNVNPGAGIAADTLTTLELIATF